jgi:hypothetical protein
MATGDTTLKYGSVGSFSFAAGLQSLASNASGAWVGIESAAQDFTSLTPDLDAEIQMIFGIVAGAPGADKAVYLFLSSSLDGTNFTDNAGGVQGSITLNAPTPLKLANNHPVIDNSTRKRVMDVRSLRALFGEVPPQVTAIVVNTSGQAFSNGVVTCTVNYRVVYANVSP